MERQIVVRKIEKELVKFFDVKLALNGLAQHAIETKNLRLLFVLAAEVCVGIKEATGRNDGKMIRLIQETVGGASGEPYCIAGIMSCLAYAELKTGILSPLPATEHAQTLWATAPKRLRVKKIPAPGAIAVWADVGKSSGHGEIVREADYDADKWFGVGFNTSGSSVPGGPVEREGNGVYYTKRSFKSTAKRKLLGFIKPI